MSEPTAAPEPESTGRKAFVTTIVAILLSPLSVALGFYLNHSLQRPVLHIEDIEQSYNRESHKIPESVVSQIRSAPLLEAQIRDVITRTELTKGDITCVDWIDEKPWKDNCVETVLAASRGIQSALVVASNFSPPKNLAGTMPSREQISAFNGILKSLIDWLVSTSTDTTETRTGGMCYSTNVLNSGDFDGVISKYGTLKFSKGTFSIYAEKYTVVKAHGYEQIEFCIDDAPESEQAALSAWQALVRAHEETPFEVVLSTGDKAFLSANAHLWK